MDEKNSNSTTFDVTMPSGISALITIRDTDIKEIKAILDATMTVDKALVEKGCKPHVRSFGGAGGAKKEKEWTGEVCPLDGGKIYHMVTGSKKDLCKCENSTYINGVAGGCKFVAWGKNLKDAEEQKAKWREEHVQSGEQTY